MGWQGSERSFFTVLCKTPEIVYSSLAENVRVRYNAESARIGYCRTVHKE
jgi:hypothetical protein